MNQLDYLLTAPQLATPEITNTEVKDAHLPFTVRIVQTPKDLSKAVKIRHAAYARHVPEFAQTLLRPEALDSEVMSVVLLAESKMNGEPLGTMRIQSNHYKPLTVEQSLVLPDWLQGKVLAEASRLGVTSDRSGRVVKTALFKAFYEYCERIGVEWMVVAGRPPIDRQYERLLFKDVYPGEGLKPLKHGGNIAHRIMALRVPDAESIWRKANHPLYDYVFRTRHVDICTTLDEGITATIEGPRMGPAKHAGEGNIA